MPHPAQLPRSRHTKNATRGPLGALEHAKAPTPRPGPCEALSAAPARADAYSAAHALVGGPDPIPAHRWQGSKARVWRQILGHPVLRLASRSTTPFRRWIEPFYGCGVTAQAAITHRVAHTYLLADLCGPLAVAHRTLAAQPDVLLARLALLAPRVDADADELRRAYSAAAQWMRHHCRELLTARGALTPHLLTAARFFLLLGSNFNGLWRVNSDGEYNVPIGARTSGKPIVFNLAAARDGLLAQAAALARPGVQLVCADMLAVIAEAGPGDVVYADPPYLGTHSAYTAGKFSAALHTQLAVALRGAARRGATVLLSNSASPLTQEIYVREGDSVSVVQALRTGGRTVESRGVVGELLIQIRA